MRRHLVVHEIETGALEDRHFLSYVKNKITSNKSKIFFMNEKVNLMFERKKKKEKVYNTKW